MKQRSWVFGVAYLVLALGALRPAAQTISVQAEMLKDWADLKATLDKLAAEMPDDKYSSKPTPPQQSFGERPGPPSVSLAFRRSRGQSRSRRPAAESVRTARTPAGQR